MEARLAHVQELVSKRFPGVRLTSEIQGWAFLEEFSRGIEAYVATEHPTAQDDRWLGVCYFQLARDMEALEALYRAQNRGEEGARVNIAHLLRFVERGDETATELRSIDLAKLTPYDTVLYYRVLSIHEENNGNLRESLKAAEEAWRRIQAIPEFAILAPSILSQLAVLYGRIGRSQRALWFLERGMQFNEGSPPLRVRIKRPSVLVNLGRYQEAQSELESIELASAAEAFQVERHWLLGEVAWCTGNLDVAAHEFGIANDLAVRLQFSYEEFLCRLALVCIYGARGDFGAAAEQASRAQSLISDRSDRLTYRFREVLLLSWQSVYSNEHALEELGALANEFGDMGLLQEQGAVRLHMAELERLLGRDTFAIELDRLQALSVTLQNHAFLAREWTLLPELRRIAARTHPRIAGRAPVVLEVLTLGQEGLRLDHKPVNIPLRRGVEVLAYFLEHKAVTLKKLLSEIFPDQKPRSAKSYFHQFRHQLRENVDGLEIEYDSESKMYRLKSEIDILWDVSELRAGRVMGETGLFLPSSGNEWALVVEQNLDPYREAIGALAAT